MNLTLHLVRHDIVRMRPWIAIWVAVLLAPILVGIAVLARSPFDGAPWKIPDTLAILTGAGIFVGFLLTVVLIHEHPLIGTTHFWLTRPISRRRLLGAKSMGALLIIALPPILIGLPWWLWCGFGLAEIGSVALQTTVVMLIIIICGATMGVLTDTLGRALLWTVAFAGVAMFGVMFFAMANSIDFGEASPALTRSLIAIVAVALELVAVIILQFLVRRRRGWWLGGAAAVMVATLLVTAQLRWSWFEVSEPPELNPARASGVEVKVNAARAMRPEHPARSGRPAQQPIHITGVITGVDPDLKVKGVGAQHRWRFPGGLEISRDTRLDVHDSPFDLRRRGPVTFVAPPALPPSLVARMMAEPPSYDARVWLQFGRMERWFEAPPTPGGWLSFGTHRARIKSGTGRGDDLRLGVVTTTPLWLRDSFMAATRVRPWFAGTSSYPQYMILDHDNGKLGWLGGQTRKVIVSGVTINWHDFTLARHASKVIWSPLPELLQSKSQGLRFAAIGWRTEAQIRRTLKVEQLIVER